MLILRTAGQGAGGAEDLVADLGEDAGDRLGVGGRRGRRAVAGVGGADAGDERTNPLGADTFRPRDVPGPVALIVWTTPAGMKQSSPGLRTTTASPTQAVYSPSSTNRCSE